MMLDKRHVYLRFMALFVAALLAISPVTAMASENAELEEVYGEGIDVQAIYDSIDRDKLRATIDVEELKGLIDEEELLAQIDEDELREELARREAEEAQQKEENPEADNGAQSGVITLDAPVEELPEGVAKVEFPVTDNKDVFDFIMDPMKLVYQTSAAKYGGGKVEESATVLFKNSDGEYLFSSTSDFLAIKNKGTIPVKVIIKASIMNADSFIMNGNKEFADSVNPELYLALIDNDGNEIPVTPGKDVVLESILQAPSRKGPTYVWNEESGQYEAKETRDGEDSYEAYSFALTGACNANGNWGNTTSRPSIVVSWSAMALDEDELREAMKQAKEKTSDEATDVSSADADEMTSGESNSDEGNSAEENSDEDISDGETMEVLELTEDEDNPESDDPEEEPKRRLTLEEDKLERLRREKLEELKEQKLQELIEERLEELVREEFERLYQEALDGINAAPENNVNTETEGTPADEEQQTELEELIIDDNG
ncbi:hypothetical protein NXH67_06045 [Butyrivibrio sp. DSM 10294]|uniref:hypothetical protein n=1 Tax=Butyrivibrio sp. DSM 10294 TaxID=2972457 RepID=UPI00234E485F|nr:hypothetical protein [Butyrivibrio sp. DSM 10294]MDC7293070.1 hypothetical protein [Butyrivibrio sp. DSM 10294]